MNELSLSLWHFDVLAVGVACSAIALLGFVVFLNDRSNVTARSFFFFALMTILWSFSNYFQYQFASIPATLLALRINLCIATWHAFSFFFVCYAFPARSVEIPSWLRYGVIPLTGVLSLLTLTPVVFSGIDVLAGPGHVTNPTRGIGIILFSAVTIGLLVLGLGILFQKMRTATDVLAGRQIRNAFIGMALTAILILSFSMLLPVFFDDLRYLPYSALFLVPFIAFISYSIYRHRLFNLKVVAVQSFTFVLGLLMFIEVIAAENTLVLLFRASLLVAIIFVGVVLTRSVTKEVEQRELIEKQEKELEIVNAQQENLLHFISHEIKGYLTEGQNAFAGILEGDYGAVPMPMKSLAQTALVRMREGVSTVMNILDASNLQKGTVTYLKNSFDFRAAVEDSVHHMRSKAAEKRLILEYTVDGNSTYAYTGDREKLVEHVLRNLIDNAIRYTPRGNIHVTLTRSNNAIKFSVKDTGVGISEEDKPRLFTEGGHGKDSIKVNVDSTGYGLFIAKQVTEAHGGTIRAESAGAEKGSEFIVELPTA